MGFTLLFALLTAAPAPGIPPELFARLDLSRPGLERVRAAVAGQDLALAATELKAYYRARVKPVVIDDRQRRPAQPVKYDTAYAEQVLHREYVFVGKPYTLTTPIDWNANPFGDVEWPIELNRHGTWVGLARAWWNTYDERFARDLVAQIDDWLTRNPRPASPRDGKFTWRTLECGIRLSGSWPETLFRIIDADSFSPALLCRMLAGIREQADYLVNFHGGGNWLVMERCGLLATSILFPEFKEATRWQEQAWATLDHELRSQVYPDGAQFELTPHYHGATLNSFRTALDIAQRNEVTPPSDYAALLERMYEYLMYVAKPNGNWPMFNDSDRGGAFGYLRDGIKRFGREDFRYVVSGGKEGKPPADTSHACRWAGQYLLRSGWTPDDVFCAMDAGPYGFGHQHEDKLTLDLWGYGQELIVDPGRYTYQGGKWRSYFAGTASHSTVLVGDEGQQRRRTPAALWTVSEPLANRWVSRPELDYAVGSYEDGYGAADDVVHVRQLLFVKPHRYYVVVDRVLGNPTAPTRPVTVQYQLARPGAVVDAQTLATRSTAPDGNVLLVPSVREGVTVTRHEGEENPPAGWVAWSLHQALKEPATLVRYHLTAAPPVAFETLILPFRGATPPQVTLRRLPDAAPGETALEITGPGWRDRLRVSHTFGAQDVVAELDGTGTVTIAGLADAGPEVNLDRNEVAATAPAATAFRLRYGYPDSGCLFETPWTEPATSCTLRLQTPRQQTTYRYQLCARRDGAETVIQHGVLRLAELRRFDFQDGLQGWNGGTVETVDGGQVFRTTAPPSAGPQYVHAERGLRLTSSPTMTASLRFRALGEGGQGYYAKVTLHDAAGLDWSAYFARQADPAWRTLKLSLADFKGDTHDRPDQQGKPMPAGLRIVSVMVTQRKGDTPQPAPTGFELDDVGFSE